MSFPYDNRTHYTQQGDRRYGLTVFAALWRISSQASRFPRLFRYPEGEASRASQVYAGPTLSGRRIGRLREPRSLALVVLRCFCQQRSTGRQPVPGRPTRAAPLASVIVELTLCRRHAYVDSTQRGGHRVGHLPSRPLGSIRKHLHYTPHLDEFARSSVVFDRHVISSFPTMPARADILTGTFSYTYMGWEPLPQRLPTLPGLLSEAGYLTMGVVDTPFFVRGGFGYDRGFDDFVWVRG